jgi:hypothetical protein
MSDYTDRCPVCGGEVDKRMRCSRCFLDVVNFNLNRTSAKIELNGNGVSMQAGILVALSFGIFSIAQLLWAAELTILGYWLYFAVLLGFELFGLYSLERFLSYRREQVKNRLILSNVDFLKISDSSKLDEVIRSYQYGGAHGTSSRLNLVIWMFRVLLSEDAVMIPYTKYGLPKSWVTYIAFFTLLNLIFIVTNPKSGLFLF